MFPFFVFLHDFLRQAVLLRASFWRCNIPPFVFVMSVPCQAAWDPQPDVPRNPEIQDQEAGPRLSGQCPYSPGGGGTADIQEKPVERGRERASLSQLAGAEGGLPLPPLL